MLRIAFGTALVLALMTTMVCRTGMIAAQGPPDPTQAAILAIAKDIELGITKGVDTGKKVDAAAAKLKKGGVDLEDIMLAYKPVDKKGIGFTTLKPGDKAKPGDGIEAKIISLSKRVDAKALPAQKADMLKMAYVNLALGEIMAHYPPAKIKAGKGPKDWKRFTDDMKEATNEFIKAVNAGKGPDVKKAAVKIEATCNDCHSAFRD